MVCTSWNASDDLLTCGCVRCVRLFSCGSSSVEELVYAMTAQCAICFDDVDDAIICSVPRVDIGGQAAVAHALCDDCFITHVHCLTDTRLRNSGFRAPCPADDWHGGVFSIEDTARVYVRKNEVHALSHYLERSLPKALKDF